MVMQALSPFAAGLERAADGPPTPVANGTVQRQLPTVHCVCNRILGIGYRSEKGRRVLAGESLHHGGTSGRFPEACMVDLFETVGLPQWPLWSNALG